MIRFMTFFLSDIRIWYLIFLAYVWAWRSHRAMATIKNAPFIHPLLRSLPAPQSLVSVIIPAKNEARNIRECLTSLLAQDYQNYEIIVANDSSTDTTEEILKSFGARIRYVNVSPTPSGWTGKNFAIHSAMNLTQGDWYLFTDADTRHQSSSISSAVSHAESRKLSFLTLLPKCLTGGFLENVLQPCIMGFMGLWFPMDQINSPDSGLSFANGQYILMRAELHQRIGGHENVFDQYLEDFALMKRAKELGERVECALGTSIFGTRMYHAFSYIWRGWRRIYLHAYEKNIAMLLRRMADLFFTVVLPFFALPFFIPATLENPASQAFFWISAAAVLGFILIVAWTSYGIVRAKQIYFIFFPAASLILMLILGNAVLVAASRQKTKWR
ncbi:MAG: glycosyltransferase [Candidatus Omnitrophica bacterium]|nr:glycosyltransferase [Candidatus Omnitrophota bacterium]